MKMVIKLIYIFLPIFHLFIILFFCNKHNHYKLNLMFLQMVLNLHLTEITQIFPNLQYIFLYHQKYVYVTFNLILNIYFNTLRLNINNILLNK